MDKSVFKILIVILLALIAFRPLNAEAQESETVSLSSLVMPAGIDSLFVSQLTVEDYLEAAEQAEGSTFGYTNLGLCNITDANNLNIRSIAAADGRIVGKLPRNAACEVMFEEGEWSFIVSGNVEGFVKTEFLSTGFAAIRRAEELATLVAVVTTDSLKVREEANTDCEIITQVPRGEVLEIEEILENGWVMISLDAEFAYVSGEYVEIKYDLRTAITMTELLYGEGVSDIRVDVCEYAKKFLGNPYVWGGTSLTKGADCSGFVQSVFRNFGVRLPRSSVQQAGVGTKISLSDIKAGDLIFYARGGRIDHVAIYIGGGQVIHASTARTGIRISRYNYRTPHAIRRVLYD
ncbi:MAG: NlpC/P60 family protein [Lachnospiraceae bacterium]|nr:NlpC/P60 family protein [Lachnospiraceae bacterium]